MLEHEKWQRPRNGSEEMSQLERRLPGPELQRIADAKRETVNTTNLLLKS